MNMMQTVKRVSAFTVNFNNIATRFPSLNLNAASVLIVGANNAGVTSLTVTGEGTFAVSTATPGVVNFTPASGFAGFPSPVKFTIANKAMARSAPFQFTFLGVVLPTATPVIVHEDLPKIDFDARTPVAGQQPRFNQWQAERLCQHGIPPLSRRAEHQRLGADRLRQAVKHAQ
jgi:hypothetical protein